MDRERQNALFHEMAQRDDVQQTFELHARPDTVGREFSEEALSDLLQTVAIFVLTRIEVAQERRNENATFVRIKVEVDVA